MLLRSNGQIILCTINKTLIEELADGRVEEVN
jgi:hypothetical protein